MNPSILSEALHHFGSIINICPPLVCWTSHNFTRTPLATVLSSCLPSCCLNLLVGGIRIFSEQAVLGNKKVSSHQSYLIPWWLNLLMKVEEKGPYLQTCWFGGKRKRNWRQWSHQTFIMKECGLKMNADKINAEDFKESRHKRKFRRGK